MTSMLSEPLMHATAKFTCAGTSRLGRGSICRAAVRVDGSARPRAIRAGIRPDAGRSASVGTQVLLNIATASVGDGPSALALDVMRSVLTNEWVDKLQKQVDNIDRQLESEKFLNGAPPHIVESLRTKRAEYVAQIKKNRDMLDQL